MKIIPSKHNKINQCKFDSIRFHSIFFSDSIYILMRCQISSRKKKRHPKNKAIYGHLFYLSTKWNGEELLLFFDVRIIRKIWRTNTTGNSFIAIVIKNSTGLMTITVAIHIKSIHTDADFCSARIFHRTSIARARSGCFVCFLLASCYIIVPSFVLFFFSVIVRKIAVDRPDYFFIWVTVDVAVPVSTSSSSVDKFPLLFVFFSFSSCDSTYSNSRMIACLISMYFRSMSACDEGESEWEGRTRTGIDYYFMNATCQNIQTNK